MTTQNDKTGCCDTCKAVKCWDSVLFPNEICVCSCHQPAQPENSWEQQFEARYMMFRGNKDMFKDFIAKEIAAAEARGRTQNPTWQKVFEQIAEAEKKAEARGRASMLKEVSGISGAYKPGFEAGVQATIKRIREVVENMIVVCEDWAAKVHGTPFIQAKAQKKVLKELLAHLDKPIEKGSSEEPLFFTNVRRAAKTIHDWAKDVGDTKPIEGEV